MKHIPTLALLASAASLSATTVVNWGSGEFFNTWNNTGLSNSSTKQVSFSAYTSPDPNGTVFGDKYYPGDTSSVTPNFYGAAFRMLQTDGAPNVEMAPSNSGWRLQNGGDNPGDSDYALSTNNGPSDDPIINHDTHQIYLWSKADFLGGADAAANVTLTSMSMNVGSPDNPSSYFVVQLYGSDFYRSENLGAGDISFTDPTTVSWYDYDPETDFSDLSGGLATLTSGDFDNLTMAGAYAMAAGGADRFVRLDFNNFSAEATVIPEPGTYALLVGLVALGALAIRRRQ